MNSINVVGRATKDGELAFIPSSGTAVLKFTLAVTRKMKKDTTDFFDCVMFGKGAEGLSPYVFKGKNYGVTGEMQSRTYESKSGQKVKVWELKVDDFTFCESSGGSGAITSQSKNYNHSQYGEDITPIDDDGEIPF